MNEREREREMHSNPANHELTREKKESDKKNGRFKCRRMSRRERKRGMTTINVDYFWFLCCKQIEILLFLVRDEERMLQGRQRVREEKLEERERS